MATLAEVEAMLDRKLAGINANTFTELAQTAQVLVRDDRRRDSAVWLTDGLHRREVRTQEEAQLWEKLLGLPKAYPKYPVVSFRLLSRVPLAT